MRHKHYEIGVAKLANTTLVKFVKLPGGWVATQSEDWNVASDYFLCMPEHKQACLHWLNGGEAQKVTTTPIAHLNLGEVTEWEEGHIFMNPYVVIRIKPKKEKRWIAVLPNGRTSGWHGETTDQLREQYGENAGWQFIKIEVEV